MKSIALVGCVLALVACSRSNANGAADSARAAQDPAPTPTSDSAPIVDSTRRGDARTPASATGGRPAMAVKRIDRSPGATKAPGSKAGGQQAMASSGPSVAQSDTAVGFAAVVGSERDIRVTLRTADGRRATVLTGPNALLVGRASGAEVWIAGRREPDGSLFVERFAVRSVDGITAHDGTLVQGGGDQLMLVTADGARHTLVRPPVGLREHVGGRVWVSGPLDKEPLAFGVIQDKQ